MIVANALTKTYGPTRAVDAIDFAVEPGRVTGFLGPNGAGKSTTMRMILGLDKPTSGDVTVAGTRYHDLPAPLREVGALLEAHAVHPGRTARDHLRWMAATNGISMKRVDKVLGLVGLEGVADQRAGRFSLGMGQRLGIAAALLGDPPVVILDEPVNGLDPEGIRWIRGLMHQLASEGRTVFVSSHLMSEMALTAEHLVVIGRGSILADCSMRDFIDEHAASYVRVKSPDQDRIADLLRGKGCDITVDGDELHVRGWTAAQIGELAGASGLSMHELSPVQSSLEEAFMTLTADSIEYHGTVGATA